MITISVRWTKWFLVILAAPWFSCADACIPVVIHLSYIFFAANRLVIPRIINPDDSSCSLGWAGPDGWPGIPG